MKYTQKASQNANLAVIPAEIQTNYKWWCKVCIRKLTHKWRDSNNDVSVGFKIGHASFCCRRRCVSLTCRVSLLELVEFLNFEYTQANFHNDDLHKTANTQSLQHLCLKFDQKSGSVMKSCKTSSTIARFPTFKLKKMDHVTFAKDFSCFLWSETCFKVPVLLM